MNDLPLFDTIASQEAATIGIALAGDNNARMVVKAKEIALEIATRKGTVTADDVMIEWCKQGGGIHDFGNSMGAVFRDRRLVWTGQYVKSIRIFAKGNMLRVWKRSDK